MTPTLFEREGHRTLDGKGEVIFVDPAKVGLIESDREVNYASYSKSISMIVKNRLKPHLNINKGYYIYAFDGYTYY